MSAPESPIVAFLQAVDRLDLEAVMTLLASDARILSADGRRAHGTADVRELLAEFLAVLRSTTHRITAQWHVDDVWIAEVEAGYELQDWLALTAVPRAVFVRAGAEGIADLRVYGAHERPLAERPPGEGGMLAGGRWVPPL